ncbi:MAG: glycosyltransferase family 2 protein [Planctomycetes bacterium]|nr:glycosyltransferase family 2 protein [Planctomycetota bacterium]
MKVAAIVINWNGAADTRRCLDSLVGCGEKLLIVLVENGSTDGSRDALAKEYPKIDRIEFNENRGFCAAANAGARHAIEQLGADALFFINNDARVERGFLAPLVDELERDSAVGAAGSKVLFDGDSSRVWCCGGMLRFRENVSELTGYGRNESRLPSAPFDCDYIPGCALLVRSELYKKIGGFDESYFAYMEDVDFGVRARSTGARLRAVPASRVLHKPSSSSGGGYSRPRKYANALNSVHFLKKHGNSKLWLAFYIFDVAGLPFAWLRETLKFGRGDAGAVIAKWRGLRDGFRGRRLDAAAFESLRK